MLCCGCSFLYIYSHCINITANISCCFKISNLLRETEFNTTTDVLLNFQMVFNHCFLFSFLFLRLVNSADSFCSPFATLKKIFSSLHANQAEREDLTPKRHFAPFIFALLLFAIVSLYPQPVHLHLFTRNSPSVFSLHFLSSHTSEIHHGRHRFNARTLSHWTKIYWMGAKRLDISMYFSFLWLKTTVFDLVY